MDDMGGCRESFFILCGRIVSHAVKQETFGTLTTVVSTAVYVSLKCDHFSASMGFVDLVCVREVIAARWASVRT